MKLCHNTNSFLMNDPTFFTKLIYCSFNGESYIFIPMSDAPRKEHFYCDLISAYKAYSKKYVFYSNYQKFIRILVYQKARFDYFWLICTNYLPIRIIVGWLQWLSNRLVNLLLAIRVIGAGNWVVRLSMSILLS